MDASPRGLSGWYADRSSARTPRRPRRKDGGVLAEPSEHPAQVVGGVRTDQALRQSAGLDREEPTIAGRDEILTNRRKDVVGRHDVLARPLGSLAPDRKRQRRDYRDEGRHRKEKCCLRPEEDERDVGAGEQHQRQRVSDHPRGRAHTEDQPGSCGGEDELRVILPRGRHSRQHAAQAGAPASRASECYPTVAATPVLSFRARCRPSIRGLLPDPSRSPRKSSSRRRSGPPGRGRRGRSWSPPWPRRGRR
jgi:hypothetical protein